MSPAERQSLLEPTAPHYAVSLKGLAIHLVRAHHLHEGIWQVYFRFAPIVGLTANINGHLKPSAMVSIDEVGLVRCEAVTEVSVDAAVVNPAPPVAEVPFIVLPGQGAVQ